MTTSDDDEEIREFTEEDFKHAIRASVRRRLTEGEVEKGQDIKDLIRFLRLTDDEFAKVLDVSPALVMNWTSGMCKPDGPALQLIKLFARSPRLCRQLRGEFDRMVILEHPDAMETEVEKEGLQEVLNKLEKAYGLRKKQIPEERLLLAVDLLKARYPCAEISIDADDQKRYGFIDIVYGNEEKKRLLVECLSKGGYVVTLNFEDNGTPHCTFESVLRQLDKVMTTAIVTPRIETGPIRFGEDWPGTFIRGDDSAFLSGQLKMALDLLKRVDFTKLDLGVTKLDDVIMRSALEGLLNTLFSSNIQKCQDTCLKLKPADECVVYKVPGDLT